MARSNRERIEQVGRWLTDNFPTPYPVEIRLAQKIAAIGSDDYFVNRSGDEGETWRKGRKIIIRLSIGAGRNRSVVIHNLIHEYAHASSLRHDSIQHERASHDAAWGIEYAKIYEKFYEEGGSKESSTY